MKLSEDLRTEAECYYETQGGDVEAWLEWSKRAAELENEVVRLTGLVAELEAEADSERVHQVEAVQQNARLNDQLAEARYDAHLNERDYYRMHGGDN